MILSAGTMDQMETMVVICCILLLSIRDTTESECSAAAESDNIPPIRMCEDGSITSDKVILDTHEAEATGETTCLCSVNSTLIPLIYIQHYGNGLNPNTSGCGSEVVADGATLEQIGRKYKCDTSPGRTLYVAIPTMNLTWNGVPGGDSKYCLNITGVVATPNTTFTITCFKPTTPKTPRPPPTTSTTSTTTHVSRTTTGTTFTKGDVTSNAQTTDVHMNTASVFQTTTQDETSATGCGCDEHGYLSLPVYAFVIIITLLCLTTLCSTVVTFLYLRRYLTSKNQPQNDLTTGTTSEIPLGGGYVNMQLPPATDRTYEDLELSHVNLTPNTYEQFTNNTRDESVTAAHQH